MSTTTYKRYALSGQSWLVQSGGPASKRVVTNTDPAARLWLTEGGAAAVNQGIFLPPGRSVQVDPSKSLYGILEPNYGVEMFYGAPQYTSVWPSATVFPNPLLMAAGPVQSTLWPTNPTLWTPADIAGFSPPARFWGIGDDPTLTTYDLMDVEANWTTGPTTNATSGVGSAIGSLSTINVVSTTGFWTPIVYLGVTFPGVVAVTCSGGTAFVTYTGMTSTTITGCSVILGCNGFSSPTQTFVSAATASAWTVSAATPQVRANPNGSLPDANFVPAWANAMTAAGKVPIVYPGSGITVADVQSALSSASYSGIDPLYWKPTFPGQWNELATTPSEVASGIAGVQCWNQGANRRQSVGPTAFAAATGALVTLPSTAIMTSLLSVRLSIVAGSTNPNPTIPGFTLRWSENAVGAGRAYVWVYIFDKLRADGGEQALTASWTGSHAGVMYAAEYPGFYGLPTTDAALRTGGTAITNLSDAVAGSLLKSGELAIAVLGTTGAIGATGQIARWGGSFGTAVTPSVANNASGSMITAELNGAGPVGGNIGWYMAWANGTSAALADVTYYDATIGATNYAQEFQRSTVVCSEVELVETT